MAELSDFMQPQANPFGGLAQGIQSGAQWAMQKAHLDVQAQQVQQQQQQHDEIKREFNAKMGQQMYEDYKDILPMGNGPYKNQLLQQFQDHWTQAGFPVDETWMAAAKDTDVSDRVASALSQTDKEMGLVTDPDIYKKLLGAIPGGMGQKLALNKIEEMPSMIRSMRMMQQLGLQGQRFEFMQQKTGQQQYESIQKPIQTSLSAILRAKQLLNAGMDPDGSIKVTPQLMATLANERTKVELGSSQSSEGSRERALYDTSATRLGSLIQNLTNAPKGVLSPAIAKQMVGEFDEMGKSYQVLHDQYASTLIGGSTPAEAGAIKGRANAFRKSMTGKGGFQKWEGGGFEGAEDIKQNDSAPASTGNDSGAQATSKNQVDPAAAQMAALIKKVKDPKEKAKFILQFKAKYGDDIATKTGVQ